MIYRMMVRASTAITLALLAGTLPAADTVKSGPRVGASLPGPFHPLNLNGDNAGQKHCLYCEHGLNPVAMVFAREFSEPLAKLIVLLDKATDKNAGNKMGSFVVFCSDDERLEKRLKDFARSAMLKHIVLSLDNAAGPLEYKVARAADVTVVLYVDATVKVNYAFKKGELKETAIDKVLADLPKILLKQ